MGISIEPPSHEDVDALLPLMRAYCDFYGVAPGAPDLDAMSRSLIDRPAEGFQLIASEDDGTAIGFATVFLTWQTLSASRVGVMNDLYVAEESRSRGVGGSLIRECAGRCAELGATELCWQTALDNATAQAVYEREGAVASRWLDYSLDLSRFTAG